MADTANDQAETAEFQFTSDWFSFYGPAWNWLLENDQPRKIIEIGSFEGRSACYMIEKCSAYGPFDLICVDSWQGGDGLATDVMGDVERRFDHNVALAIARSQNQARLRKFKSYSHPALLQLVHEHGPGTFDLIYIDGSHAAPDVLVDAVLAFQLLKVGGLMIFDDYLWRLESHGQEDVLNMPKLAIDAFLNIFQRKMAVIDHLPIYQLYTRKIAD